MEITMITSNWVCDKAKDNIAEWISITSRWRAAQIDMEHLQQFITLWELVSGVQLDHRGIGTIKWKFTNDGKYTASFAYKMQFEVLVALI
jgi:hypothetical protein